MPPSWLTKRRALLLLAGFVFFTAIYVIRIRKDMVDFRVNYQAGARLAAGEPLYRVEDGHFMFKYLPFSALVYLPLSLLPLEAAKVIWYVALVGGAVLVFHLSKTLTAGEGTASMTLYVFPPLILAKFFLREMALGQINILATLILLGMIGFLKSTPSAEHLNTKRAGLLWGLATSLKPYAAIFLPYFIVTKRWPALGAGGAAIVLALLLPTVFYGPSGNLALLGEWASTLSQSTPTLFLSNDNISLIAFFMKWTHRQDVSLLLTGVTIGILAVLVLLVIRAGARSRSPMVLECSLLLTLIPLVSPLGWDYTLLMSVLAVTLIIKNYSHYSLPWRVVLVVNFCVIALSIYDLIGRPLYGAFMASSILTINFLIVIGFLVALRFKGSSSLFAQDTAVH
ncbi:MAG: glycosyltransferase family 87 protein [Vicinamibacteria bacterium]